ncbi:hypothetical protein GH714_005129 [Hevea brasiliensis]|uniref:Transposase MuDR plant domain-containing protein n=1 Tax=Hevea brasiliensis TaxID=3981 RepID=A0A6A6MX16_HEVBR|nr:hypothetical protein GH714_005129 [Hevea brasiliensis]
MGDEEDDSDYHVESEGSDLFEDVDTSENDVGKMWADYEGSKDGILHGNSMDLGGRKTMQHEADMGAKFESFDSERDNELFDFNEEVGLKDPTLCKGMKFTNGHMFRKALREWAIRKGDAYVMVKNNRFKITAVCKNKCGYRVHGNKLRDCDTLQIKTFKSVHNYPREAYNHIVSSKYLAFKCLEKFRENPNWDVRAMQKKIQRELGTKISISKCYRENNKAKAINDGDVRE